VSDSDQDVPESDALKASQKLWDFMRSLSTSKGIDIQSLLAKLATKQEQQLISPGAREDFNELCEAGCVREVLGGVVFLLQIIPAIERFWTLMVGDPDRRKKLTRTLETAAQELDHFFPALPDEVSQAKLQTKIQERFAEVGHIDPTALARELRFHITLLNAAENLASDTETHNVGEFLKYILVSYVNRATGRFRDRNVAGLLAGVGVSSTFEETAHRMWRNRNFDRLDAHFSGLVNKMHDMGVVISRSKT